MEQITKNVDIIDELKDEQNLKSSMVIFKNIFARDKLIVRLIFITSCILVAYFIYYFIAWNIMVSMTDWEGLTQTYGFVGFENYFRMFNDPIFWISFKNNMIFMLVFIPLSIIIGLFLAILLDQKIRREGVFRTIYLLPYALSFIVTAYLWQWMFVEDGVINFLLDSLGLSFLKMSWISDPNIALFSVSFALIWQFSGYIMLIFLAAIRTIPQSHIMAAQIDGASGFKLYLRVIIPQIKTSTFTAFVILMIFSLKAFDFIWILTDEGGPGWATTILPITIYKTAFKSNQFAYSAAIATTLLLIIMLIVIPYLYITYRKRE
ncbi:MAG: carbohydrate ABC transporter permease [Promethearchaeota archaeon]